MEKIKETFRLKYDQIRIKWYLRSLRAQISSSLEYLNSLCGYVVDPAAVMLYYLNWKHGVEGELIARYNGSRVIETLCRIVKDDSERYAPLPAAYVADVVKMIIVPRRKRIKFLTFEIAVRGITEKELEEERTRQHAWCERAWAAYD